MKIFRGTRAASTAGLFAIVLAATVPSTFGTADRAEATAPTIHTHSVVASGFETMKSSLVPSQKRALLKYVNEHLDSPAETVIRSVTSASQDSSVRKVVVRFSVTEESVYRFSWNYSDDGTIYVGPSYTASIIDFINLPPIPEDGVAGDVMPGDDAYGYIVFFDAGGAAYFGGWCTTPDGTGTMYWPGSGTILPDVGPGVHTLYAIYSQG